MGILETFIYHGLADGQFQSEFKYLHVIIARSFSFTRHCIFASTVHALYNAMKTGTLCMRYWSPNVTSAPLSWKALLSWKAVHAEPLRMRTNVVDFRVMRRLYRREWNWLCVNQHPWQRTRGHGVWRLTSIAHWRTDRAAQ